MAREELISETNESTCVISCLDLSLVIPFRRENLIDSHLCRRLSLCRFLSNILYLFVRTDTKEKWIMNVYDVNYCHRLTRLFWKSPVLSRINPFSPLDVEGFRSTGNNHSSYTQLIHIQSICQNEISTSILFVSFFRMECCYVPDTTWKMGTKVKQCYWKYWGGTDH